MQHRKTKPKSFLKRWVLGDFSFQRLGRSALIIYACVCLYAWFFADTRIFFPGTANYSDSAEILKLTTTDGVRISALYLPSPRSSRYPQGVAQQTILYSHGNAGDLGDFRPLLIKLQQAGFSVFAYDYRGYGTSEGKPSESGSYRDIDAAYAYLTQTLRIPPQQIIAHGQSLGGAITIDLASRQPVGGLILESTFVSAFRVLLPFPFLPFEKFHSMGKLPKVNCPVLVIHGTQDPTIPFWHGEKLYAIAPQPKQFLWVEGADHENLREVAGDRYTQAIQAFAQSILYPPNVQK
jgi:abhydrolase domain-containing protein 17